MTESSRPRLRSEISRGHSLDDPREGTSARTRPLSYDEIMRRRKSKKQKDVFREETQETDHVRNEESIKSLDHHSRDASADDMKYSRDHAREAGFTKKEEKSSRLEDTPVLSKKKESHDSGSKQKYEKDLTNGREAVKTYRREHVSGKLDEVSQAMDSRSKHKHDKGVKNGTEVPKSVRGGYVSGRIDEENPDMNAASSKDKHENIVKNKAPVLKVDRLEIVRHKMNDGNREMDSRSKAERTNYVKNDTRVLETDSVKNRASLLNSERRGNVQHKMDEKNRDMDSRSMPKHTNYVNATRVLETDRRGHQSGRIDEESHDMNVGSKDKNEKFVKYSTPSSKTDRRGNVRDKLDEESRDVESRSKNKHEKETGYSAEGLKSNQKGHVRSKQGEVLRDAVKYDNGDKRHRDSLAHNRYIERSGGASEIETKRKNQSIDDEKHRPRDSIKKHDSGHRLGPDNSERKMKMEDSHLRHDESSTKMRRSSQERSKDKDRTHRRSRSASPKARKNILSREYDHGPLSSHPKIDDSGHRLGSVISEKKEKMGFSHLRHDESRAKRRRSRSQDRSNNKDRRSRSASPKARKNILSREYDCGPLSSHPKKGDRGHRLGSDISEKKQKTELSHLRRDESRTKRRRSRSQERSNDKDRRSRSASPKTRKNILSREYDHGPLSSHPKKDDRGHRLGSGISEKKEKVELSHVHHDESKTKRRRSRSQERSSDKDRRSRSASPQARKNMLSRDHDHDPLSSHSQKGRSRPNDVDRGNMASNGTNSHHRQHSGFSSGIGGYSPRKRKTDAAIKTPSPIRSPERKRAGRDLPSSGVDRSISDSNSQPVSQIMSSNKVDLAVGTSVASSIGMPMITTFFHGLSTFKDASVDSVQLTQATRPMRRLYIDNIPASASEKEIMESFNTHLLYSGSNHIRGTRPCISCMIHKEKGQALLEFLTPEDASAALSFDGRSLYGSMLKIRRPKDYVEMTSGSAERLKARAGRNNAISDVAASDIIKDVAISDLVKDSPHKIFVGGIGEGLSSEMILEIFSVLGPLKAFRFSMNENLNEPCVFLEYADQSITSKACAALNGMKLGERILTVAQAIPDTSFKGNIEAQPLYGIPEHVKPLLEKPSLVLKLSNVLDQKAMGSLPEMDLEEILEDVRLECSRFGSVVSINAVTTSDLHTIDSKVQEVVNEEPPFEPHEETEPRVHHLNIDLPDVTPKHDARGIKDGKSLTYAAEFNVLDIVEGEKQDLATSPAIEAEASRMNTSDMKEAGVAANGTQQCIVFDDSTIENTEIINDSGGNHEESIQGSEVSSIKEPNEDTGIVKLDESEASRADDVEQMDKAADKQQEVVTVSNDSSSTNLRTEIWDGGNIFEVGCILVEFKRTEASCMAAHCLHGRLFDDRIVTVEYVPLEAYQARFPK